MSIRTIDKIISAIEQPEEDSGTRVRRSIGSLSKTDFNPFLSFSHFSNSRDSRLIEAPHAGQEIITLILRGAVAHEDSTGSKGVLYPGDLELLTAGKAVACSEMPVPAENGAPAEGLQLWVDLPECLKETEPRYRDIRTWEIPEVVLQDGLLRIKVISGKCYGVESTTKLSHHPIQFFHFLMKPGSSFKLDLEKHFNYFLYVISGNKLMLNNNIIVREHKSVFFNLDGDHIVGANCAKCTTQEEVEFVLIGGEPLDQKMVKRGPFVHTSAEGILKTYSDYHNAKNGFAHLKSWDCLISQGVTKEMVEGPLNGSLAHREHQRLKYLSLQNPDHIN